MRKGLVLSFFLHIFVFFFAWVNIPELFIPRQDIKTIQIKLVAGKNVKKTTDVKKQAQPKRTQQSAAPAEAAKPKPKKVEAPKAKPKPKAPTVVQKAPVKKKIVKKKEAPKPPKVEPIKEVIRPKKHEARPAKLDKSKKKNIVKDESKKKPLEIPLDDDFLKALSFIDDLKAEESALYEGEESTDKTTLNLADQNDLAIVQRHIEKFWNKTPGTRIEKRLVIKLRVNRDGTLASIKIAESSGNGALDRSLERAVRRASPLPIPAAKYDDFKEIVLRFIE